MFFLSSFSITAGNEATKAQHGIEILDKLMKQSQHEDGRAEIFSFVVQKFHASRHNGGGGALKPLGTIVPCDIQRYIRRVGDAEKHQSLVRLYA